MNLFIKPFTGFGHAERRGDNGQPTDATLPIGMAAFMCLACFACIYLSSKSWVVRLGVWWAELLVYALIPVSVAFVILYRSRWHLEMVRSARTSCLILFSFLILGGDLLFLGIAVALFCIFVGVGRVGPG